MYVSVGFVYVSIESVYAKSMEGQGPRCLAWLLRFIVWMLALMGRVR